MVYFIIIGLFILFIGWNALLWGYRDKHTDPIEPQPDQVFDPRCLPIILEHDPPAERALIMVHGFPSTPHTYEHAAKRAYAAGYDVFVPLLPGFGTKPTDLFETTFTQWYGYLSRFFLDKRVVYPFLGVIGTSMGGALTLKLGEDFCSTPKAPDALVTIAAPVFINDLRKGVIQKWNMYLMRTVALFTPALSPDFHYGGTTVNDGEEIWIGYRGTFVRAGLSLVYALRGIRKNLHRISCPLMSLHDVKDGTVPYRNLQEIAQHVQAKPFIERTVEMTSSHTHHVLLMYPSIQNELLGEILDFCNGLASQKESLRS